MMRTSSLPELLAPAGSPEALRAAGYNAKSYVSEGTAHEFLTWRRCLREMVPMLFK